MDSMFKTFGKLFKGGVSEEKGESKAEESKTPKSPPKSVGTEEKEVDFIFLYEYMDELHLIMCSMLSTNILSSRKSTDLQRIVSREKNQLLLKDVALEKLAWRISLY